VEGPKDLVGQRLSENITAREEMKRSPHQHTQQHGIQERCSMIGDQDDRLTIGDRTFMLKYDPPKIKSEGRPHDDLGDRIQHGYKLMQFT
jgi:hypothetical protein